MNKLLLVFIFSLFTTSCITAPNQLKRDIIKNNLCKIGPSDYYINLISSWWGLDADINASNMTNLHTLYIVSHGYSVFGSFRLGVGKNICSSKPDYSIKNISEFFAKNQIDDIHNIYFAACDSERSFSSKEVVKYFPSVTNVVHVTPGNQGYYQSFKNSIILYKNDSTNPPIAHKVVWATREGKYYLKPGLYRYKQVPYIAELFLPGETKPYRITIATRDLLQPKKK